MSWDIVIQGFRDGDAGPIAPSALDDVLGPWRVDDESGDEFWRVRADDGGEADVHGVHRAHEGILVNHLGAGRVVDLLVCYAVRAGAVLLAVGCPTMITDAGQRGELPPELRAGPVVLVRSGQDFRDVVARC